MRHDRITTTAIVAGCLSAALASAAPAQQPEPPFVPPIAGEWEPIRSLGQPPRWKPYVGGGFGIDAPLRRGPIGPSASAGVYRDITNPVVALLGFAGEVYAGQRSDIFHYGARLQLVSPALYLRTGIDWNARLRRADIGIGLTLPPTRGGWFGHGGQLRFDYVPGREHSLIAGFELPVGQQLGRRTRPRHIPAHLPVARPPAGVGSDTALLTAMRWITQLQTFTWQMGDGPLGHDDAVRHARAALGELVRAITARMTPDVDASVYNVVLGYYHGILDNAFASVLHGTDLPPADITVQARRIVLEEVVLPYNRLIGQYRAPDVLHGLAARARARFLALLLLHEMPPAQVDATMRVFDSWLINFELTRAELALAKRDRRLHWLPLALVLRPEEHATQQQVDAIVEHAVGRPITTGNSTRYIDALEFQAELTRSINDARDYHVLWIHDYRGRNEAGEPDGTAFVQTTDGYLTALLHRVREYDGTGTLPAFMMLIDQHSYEEHDARLWLDLLERPLTHSVRLPATHAAMQARIDALQDSLRAAVAASRRLSADAHAFGSQWLEQVVKVHVNVTYPSDVSYRAPRVLRLPFAGDNLMRDHRKMVVRDIVEGDPAAGEVILTGVGVGDRYATAIWNDRGIVLTGPGALEAKYAARAVLQAHGLLGPSMPPPLRPQPYADDHGARVAALEAAGANARVLQVHNATGFGDKDATFLLMLLYDLAPAGTVIYIPDSLWLSFDRLGQLVQAALRGCHVIVVVPALDNAPNTGFPQLSRMQELATRAAIVQEQLGPLIRAGGGDFRVGMYTRATPLDDVAGTVADVEHAFASTPWLADLFPLSDDAWQALRSLRVTAQRADNAQHNGQRPMLHRKTQLLAGRDVLAGLSTAPELDELFAAKLRARAGIGGMAPDLPAQRLAEVWRGRAAGISGVLYLMAGTKNMDPRSAMLDGEATALVAGHAAAQAFMDFVVLSGGVTWVESPDEVAALLPPLAWWQRLIGRILHPVL
jgi:hypothetical protein